MSGGKLYRTFDVWRRKDDQTAVRYTCFEDMDASTYWVKAADYIRYPLDKAALANLNAQRDELVLEALIFEDDEEAEFRKWHVTIREAIETFDRDFENA